MPRYTHDCEKAQRGGGGRPPLGGGFRAPGGGGLAPPRGGGGRPPPGGGFRAPGGGGLAPPRGGGFRAPGGGGLPPPRGGGFRAPGGGGLAPPRGGGGRPPLGGAFFAPGGGGRPPRGGGLRAPGGVGTLWRLRLQVEARSSRMVADDHLFQAVVSATPGGGLALPRAFKPGGGFLATPGGVRYLVGKPGGNLGAAPLGGSSMRCRRTTRLRRFGEVTRFFCEDVPPLPGQAS